MIIHFHGQNKISKDVLFYNLTNLLQNEIYGKEKNIYILQIDENNLKQVLMILMPPLNFLKLFDHYYHNSHLIHFKQILIPN